MSSSCSIDTCDRAAIARGWCTRHYARWRKFGDPRPDMLPKLLGAPAIERFQLYVDRNGPVPGFAPHLGPCWLWRRGLTAKGYARFRVDGRQVLAHVFSYEHFVGPIPSGLRIDHLCRVRHCVRWDHLQPVTNRENNLRGKGGRLRTHCIHGHRLTPDNVRMEGRRRRCLRCERERVDRRRAQRQQLIGTPGHVGGAAINAAKTHCPRGHEYTPENTYLTKPGTRSCKECRRVKSREWYDQHRSATTSTGSPT